MIVSIYMASTWGTLNVKVKVKQSHYRPGVAQRVTIS